MHIRGHLCISVFRIKSSSQPTPQRTRYASHPASACSSSASGPTIRPNRSGIKSDVEGRRNLIDVIYSPPIPKVRRPPDLRNLAQHVVRLSLMRNSKIESYAWTRPRSLLATRMMVPGATSRSADPLTPFAHLQTSSMFIPIAKIGNLSIYFDFVLVA